MIKIKLSYEIYHIMKEILCLIPARSGSKSLPHKNVKSFHGKPLLAWSIIQAKQSKYQMRIIVRC